MSSFFIGEAKFLLEIPKLNEPIWYVGVVDRHNANYLIEEIYDAALSEGMFDTGAPISLILPTNIYYAFINNKFPRLTKIYSYREYEVMLDNKRYITSFKEFFEFHRLLTPLKHKVDMPMLINKTF